MSKQVPLFKQYQTLIKRFAKENTGEYEHVSFPKEIKVYVNINKAVCLAYLKWKLQRKRDDRTEFTSLAIEWRNVANRLAQPRSLLEKVARKNFKERKKHLSEHKKHDLNVAIGLRERDLRKGIHAEDKETRAARARAHNIARNTDPDRHPRARTWIVTTPEGEEIVVHNLQRWCHERGMRPSKFYECALHTMTEYKGYKCRYANDIRNKRS
jgi:hypothetical protein